MALWTNEELEETRQKVLKILDEGVYPYLQEFYFMKEWYNDICMVLVMIKHKKFGQSLEEIIIDMHEKEMDAYHIAHPQYKRPNWTYD